jgi:endonuclease/exonuclease/phosphatase (EEP) superfamily protein YafD
VSRTQVIAWLMVLPGFAWAVLRLSGWSIGWPLVPLMAFTPYALIATLVPLVITTVLRQWPAAGAALVVTVALGVVVLPRGFGGPDPSGAEGGPQLRVLTLNMEFGGADPTQVVDLVRDNRVDLLALEEFTPQARDALEAAGLDALLPETVGKPVDDSPSGTALYSRFPLTQTGVRTMPDWFYQVYATLQVPGAPPLLVEAVHPCAPSGMDAVGWWRDSLAQEPRAQPHGPVRLLLGDFNATLDHAPLQALLHSGYRDAAAALGDGFVGTWPYDRTRLPKVTIDHVLADTRIAIRAVSAHQVDDTDHRGLYAELRLPSGTAAPLANP